MSIENILLHINRKDEILNLLSQLTNAPNFDELRFYYIINNLNNNHNIYLYIQDNKIIGMITLLFEQKLIHNGSCVAHIEDLVVHENYQGKSIGRKLIEYCLKEIKSDKCYKIILDCKRELIPFYEKFGFNNNNVQMSKYI